MFQHNLASAIQDFHQARRQAKLESLLARLTGESTELLSYEEVRRKLRARESALERLKDIPIEAIVGSVGRYRDFTRSFLPRHDRDQDRWARVEVAMTGMSGVPPIELYKVGDAYFVKDGNHRVSVARQLGATHIQAYVTRVNTKVPLSPSTDPDDLIVKAEYADFLEHTHIDELRPEANLSVTVPGQYQVLAEHIEVHRYFMGLEQQRDIPYEEAVAHWYDHVYLPAVKLIRERGILRDFPERTETDLYLWIAEHRATLEEELGWEISSGSAAEDFAARFSRRPWRVASRVGQKVLEAMTPDELEAGPPAGQWREKRLKGRQDDRLFNDILVAISSMEESRPALDQALTLAQREEARLQGLHVVPSEAQKESEEVEALQADFNSCCEAEGVTGNLVVEAGKVPNKICERARWSDLVLFNLAYPPLPRPIEKLSSGVTNLLRRCPRPALAVPGASSHLQRALLAYDGTPKAREALFIATYISGRWDIPLVVVTVAENGVVTSEIMAQGREYLESHGVEAAFLEESGPVAEAILKTAEERQCDLILMGGYGRGPMLQIALGNAVDQVLRKSRRPTLICR